MRCEASFPQLIFRNFTRSASYIGPIMYSDASMRSLVVFDSRGSILLAVFSISDKPIYLCYFRGVGDER